MSLERLNPEGMHRSPAFTQVIAVSQPGKLIFVGGQNGVNKEGKIVGGDVGSQAEQSFRNVLTALKAAGATLGDVVKMTIYLVQGQPIREAFAAVQPLLVGSPPPTLSVIVVAGLANPAFLIEIEAMAVLTGGAS